MDLQKDIKKLVTYGLDKKLIEPEDEIIYDQSVSGSVSFR